MASRRLNLARAAMAEAVAREMVEGEGSIYCCSSWAFYRGAAHLAAPRWPSRSLDSGFSDCSSSWAFCRGAALLAAPRRPSRCLDYGFRLDAWRSGSHAWEVSSKAAACCAWRGSAGGTSLAKALPRFRFPVRVARGVALLAATRWQVAVVTELLASGASAAALTAVAVRTAAGMAAAAATALLAGLVERRGVVWCGRGRGWAEGGA